MHPNTPSSRRELGLNILLVDDHALNRFMVQTILEKWNCTITIAEDGLSAIQKMLSDENIDLILMDMRMPVMDGKTASEFIRSRMRSTIPIIAITSDAIQYNNINMEEHGISFFISKPFTQEELYSKSMQALEARIPELPESRMDLGKLMHEDQRFIARMIDLFLEDTPQKISLLEKAIADRDTQVLMDVAHTIKPSLQYLAGKSVSETAMRVEKNEDSSANIIYAESFLLISELVKLSQELKTFRETLET